MTLGYTLSNEIVNYIFEYNPLHRENMLWVLHDIRNIQYCDVCDKIIMKRIYSRRNCNMVCCSVTCVENYNLW
jgi:hypothetical protein